MKILKRILGKRKVDLSDNVPQECPDDWNLTLDDLFQEINEGKRKSIEPQEGAWTKEYERSLIPASILQIEEQAAFLVSASVNLKEPIRQYMIQNFGQSQPYVILWNVLP
jgi:hypothetical protein